MKRNNSHKVSVEGDFYIKGNNVIMDGSSRETYTYFPEGNDTIVWEQMKSMLQ